LRWIGGGTFGGLVSTAWIGSPCGGPKSPGSVADAAAAVGGAAVPALAVASGLPEQAAIANTLAAASNVRNILDMVLPLRDPCAQRRRHVRRGD
jgi:hypothetical protein